MNDDEQNNVKDWSKIAGSDEQTNNPSPDTEGAKVQDSTSGVLEHPSYKALEDKLTATEQKMHEHWDKAVRITAELENVRRRAERDVESAHKFALENFVTGLLPVVDSLEQGLRAELDTQDDAIKTMKEGMALTLKLLLDVFAKFNLEQINPEGEPFNPQKHEAMSMQDDDSVAPGTVLVVFQKGYLLNGRVLRPARVIVAKGQAKSVDEKA